MRILYTEMGNRLDITGFVEKARLGDQEAFERLVELLRDSLRQDIYRLTLRDDLTNDIVQETLFEMLKARDKLPEPEGFWPWLYTVAQNKLRLHYRRESRRRTVSLSAVASGEPSGDNADEGLARIMGEELKHLILRAMESLSLRHRSVLMMRCYREMKYSQIAKCMDCSELGAKLLFYRAKKNLRRQLARNGLGKGSLMMALVLFGKLTAQSEAAMTSVSVTAATVRVGVGVSIAGFLTSKAVISGITAAAIAGAGHSVIFNDHEPEGAGAGGVTVNRIYDGGSDAGVDTGGDVDRLESSYYFPDGRDGTVMIRVMKCDEKGVPQYCSVLQNGSGNFYYDEADNTVYKNNFRCWSEDLRVRTLPVDSEELKEYLGKGQRQPGGIEMFSSRIPGGVRGLLVVTDGIGANEETVESSRRKHALDEEEFRFNWPGDVRVVDDRDVMHKRGWTYFRIKGSLGGKKISGVGRIPFVYEESKRHYPWARLRVGSVELVGSGDGKFFEGLNRPWVGLHTLDTIRRDTARESLGFETRLKEDSKAEVSVRHEDGKTIYTVNMEGDLIERIQFVGGIEGDLHFTYLQEIDTVSGEFSAPARRRFDKTKDIPVMLRLLNLAGDEKQP